MSNSWTEENRRCGRIGATGIVVREALTKARSAITELNSFRKSNIESIWRDVACESPINEGERPARKLA